MEGNRNTGFYIQQCDDSLEGFEHKNNIIWFTIFKSLFKLSVENRLYKSEVLIGSLVQASTDVALITGNNHRYSERDSYFPSKLIDLWWTGCEFEKKGTTG